MLRRDSTEDEVQGDLAQDGGPREPEPTMLHETDRVAPEPHRRIAHVRLRRSMEQLLEPSDDAPEELPDAAREGFALEDEGEEDHRHDQHRDPDHGRRHEGGPELPGEEEQEERDHRQRELREDVPDAGDTHVEGDIGAEEPPRVEDRVGQTHRDRAAGRQRVRDRGRRLRQDGRLR